jgi:4-amino-4-deoxy-L-arabinose transferase-like glycosyltransferase
VKGGFPSGLLLLLILAAYTALAAGYAVATPPWNNPDEPAHFNYVRHLARVGRLPELRPGDWDAELLERLKAARFPADAPISGIRYEGHQPPLYYLLAAGVYLVAGDEPVARTVFALKVLSIVFGAVVVLCAFVVGRQVAPSYPEIAVLAAATAAFVPMHTAIAAAINNDNLANALAGVTLVALGVTLRRGLDDRGAVLLGLLFGALVITKVTVYPYVALGLAVMVVVERRASEPETTWLATLRRPLLALASAGAVSSWWLLRNGLVYGWRDPLASARHADVVVGQPRWASLDLAAAEHFVRTLFRSFWGQFGWMGVVLDERLYLLYFVLTAAGLAGLVVAIATSRKLLESSPIVRDRVVMLAAAVALNFVGVVFYNLTFIQPQGRYLFPALVPIAVFLAIGWTTLANLVARLTPWSEPVRRWLVVWFAAALGVLDFLCLARYVAPAFR